MHLNGHFLEAGRVSGMAQARFFSANVGSLVTHIEMCLKPECEQSLMGNT